MKHSIFIFLLSLVWITSYSQDNNDSVPVFTLGEVVVKSYITKEINSSVDAAKLKNFAKNNVATAMNMLPGVNLSAVGARNESMVYVRGFDLRQVPLLIDGIPVYVPYDGYVDLARFTTFDLSAINVSKGYTSVLYGPNALGGAINLISRKPVKRFEFDGASGWLSGGYRTNINIGANLGKFYIQAGASNLSTLSPFLQNRSNSINGKSLELTEQEKEDIVLFLKMLTDSGFVVNKNFSNPFLN